MGGAPEIEAASPCKHAGRVKLADDATVLVNLPPTLSPGHNETYVTYNGIKCEVKPGESRIKLFKVKEQEIEDAKKALFDVNSNDQLF